MASFKFLFLVNHQNLSVRAPQQFVCSRVNYLLVLPLSPTGGFRAAWLKIESYSTSSSWRTTQDITNFRLGQDRCSCKGAESLHCFQNELFQTFCKMLKYFKKTPEKPFHVHCRFHFEQPLQTICHTKILYHELLLSDIIHRIKGSIRLEILIHNHHTRACS